MFLAIPNRSTALVLAIQEPQPTGWHQPLDDAVQGLHVTALAFWLSGNVVGDLLCTVISRSFASQTRRV
jgi:hypothetical protein